MYIYINEIYICRCDGKVVRIFNVAFDASCAALLIELVGHTEKSFNVRSCFSIFHLNV